LKRRPREGSKSSRITISVFPEASFTDASLDSSFPPWDQDTLLSEEFLTEDFWLDVLRFNTEDAAAGLCLPQPDACNQAGLSFFSGDFADVNPPQDYLSNTEGIFNTPLLPTNEPFEELGASFPPLFLLPEVPTQRSTVPETEDDEGHARCARCEKRFPSVRQRK
jgi:hypothetical protein